MLATTKVCTAHAQAWGTIHPAIIAALLAHLRTLHTGSAHLPSLPQPVDSAFLDFFGANTKQAYEGVLRLEEAVATPAPPTSTPTPTPATPTPTPSAPSAGASNATRWCIPFPADAAFLSACSTAAATGNTADVSFDCVVGGTQDACISMIAAGEADLIVLGGELVGGGGGGAGSGGLARAALRSRQQAQERPSIGSGPGQS